MAFSTLLLALLVSSVAADFSPSFRSFINSTYGPEMLAALARTDIGDIGSYGGGSHVENSATSKRPIILVHGTTNTAATFDSQRDYFMSHGWSAETVYGTTYGDGGVTDALHVKMLCEYVQQVRNMIEVVHAFTQQKVDVVGYSLGSPIARKAILGGACVDDKSVDLGASLTSIVETYVSVAGANRGSGLCVSPIIIDIFAPTCNPVNGLWCASKFIKDINKETHYEGSKVFSIYGRKDDKVMFSNVCWSRNSRINGADGEMDNAPGNHDQILSGTVEVQAQLLEHQSF